MYDKVYKSKLGLEFHISPYPAPTKNGRPTFTQKEYDWIKSQRLSPDEFSWLHKARLEDYTCPVIPETEVSASAKLAKEYGDKILATLRGKAIID